MSKTPHDLAEEFPDQTEQILAMKQADAHFAKLVEQYYEVNRAVARAESRIDAMTESAENALRRQRAHIKDHIAYHLTHGAQHG